MIKKFFKYFSQRQKISKLDNLLDTKIEGIDLNMLSCDVASKFVWKNAEHLDIPYKRLLIKTDSQIGYLGHVNMPNQGVHEVVEIDNTIYDLYYPKKQSLDLYLREAYSPKEGIKLVVEELN